MAIPIVSEKYKIAKFLSAIRNGEPLRPTGGAWTAAEALMAAGVCRYMAMSHGPHAFGGPDTSKLPLERAEAVPQTTRLVVPAYVSSGACPTGSASPRTTMPVVEPARFPHRSLTSCLT